MSQTCRTIFDSPGENCLGFRSSSYHPSEKFNGHSCKVLMPIPYNMKRKHLQIIGFGSCAKPIYFENSHEYMFTFIYLYIYNPI